MIETQLSAYKIVDELGSGGMGKVYLAELTKNAAGLDQGHRVALKVVHPHLLETEGFFKRFLREAEIGKSVQQENVVRTYDCDAVMRDGSQHNFLVMEYVEGQTLRDLLKELGTVPEELCRHIACEMAKALQAIHEAGVVHRDLKPENVLITKDHVVKVMDLGVARLQDEIIRLSQTGAFVGSVHYASPEQFKGGGEDVDGRSDLHALGAMLYELSTGKHPYQDEDVKVVLRRILSEEPRRIGELNPQLSPFFEEVVQQLLAKERRNRFQTAAELLDVLEQGEESDWWKQRAQALRIETKRPLRRIRVPRETALYGRDDELAKLQALYDQAKQGHGRVLLIEGEAGIGRTRLVDEFVGRLQHQGEDVNFLHGDYPPGGAATAAGAFSTAYREQFGAEGIEDTLKGYLSESPLLIPAFGALLRGDPTPRDTEPLSKDSLQTVFVHATRALAAERPTIILIDDLHFAPEEGRALFASLALAIPEHRVLLIGTTRPGLPEEWVSNLERREQFTRMTLPRLGAKDIGKLILDVFRSQRLADELGFQIVTKADGNPFFAFEIIRGLREGKFITQQDDGTWISTQVIKAVQIPSSVMDLIDARISDLDEEGKDLLDVASCCGFEFNPALVADVLGMKRIPALKLLGRIEKRNRLIRSAGLSFVFDHHQVQEALYEGLPGMLRQEYHLAIGEALETKENAADTDPRELDGALAVELCEHFFKGAAPHRAYRDLDAALQHLEKGYLNDAALALADRALEAKGLVSGEARVDLLLRKAERFGILGRRDEQRAALDEALPLAEALENPLAAARVRIGLALHLLTTSHFEEALEAVQLVLEQARVAGDKPLESKAERFAGNASRHLGRLDDAKLHWERAVRLAHEIGDHVEEGGGTNNLAIFFAERGDGERAVKLYERSLELLRQTDRTDVEALVGANLAVQYNRQGRREEARTLHERQLEASRATGNRKMEATASFSLGGQFELDGRYADALPLSMRALTLDREVGDRQHESMVTVGMGRTYDALGAIDKGLEAINGALAITRGIGDRRGESAVMVALANHIAGTGDLEEAERLLADGLSIQRDLELHRSAGESLVHMGRCLRAQGKASEAQEYLDEAISLAKAQDAQGVRLLALAERACLPGESVDEALRVFSEYANRLGVPDTTRVRFLLWQATGDRQHLEEAHRLLTLMRDHAPEEYRGSMIDNVPLHRDIMQAWKSQDPELVEGEQPA